MNFCLKISYNFQKEEQQASILQGAVTVQPGVDLKEVPEVQNFLQELPDKKGSFKNCSSHLQTHSLLFIAQQDSGVPRQSTLCQKILKN